MSENSKKLLFASDRSSSDAGPIAVDIRISNSPTREDSLDAREEEALLLKMAANPSSMINKVITSEQQLFLSEIDAATTGQRIKELCLNLENTPAVTGRSLTLIRVVKQMKSDGFLDKDVRSRWSSLRVKEQKNVLETLDRCHHNPTLFANVKHAVKFGFETDQEERKRINTASRSIKRKARASLSGSSEKYDSSSGHTLFNIDPDQSPTKILETQPGNIASRDLYFFQKAKTEESIRLLKLIESQLFPTFPKETQEKIIGEYMKTVGLDGQLVLGEVLKVLSVNPRPEINAESIAECARGRGLGEIRDPSLSSNAQTLDTRNESRDHA